MELEKLRATYKHSDAVRTICNHMAARERNQNETKLHRIVRHLADDSVDLKRSEIIAAFRALEEADCGKYVEGRHGWKSRFVWAVKSLDVSAAAKGQGTLERDVSSENGSDDSDDDADLIEHTFVLRPDLPVSIELPTDLTKSEAARLAAFLQVLPFDDEGQ